MIGEKLCFAIVFAAEAMIAWLYFEYILSKKNSLLNSICSFAIGYVSLFVFTFLDNTTLNAIMFCVVNYNLIRKNYSCSAKTTLLHSSFLCFAMVGAEVLVALWLGIYGYEFSAYTNDFRAMIALAILSKLLYLLFSVIGSRIFAPHKHIDKEPKQIILFCGLPLLSSIIAVVIVHIGMNAGFSDTVGIMTIIIVVTLLSVNLMFFALYNVSAE